ncbi:MAG TPA: hypothetical protein VK808_10170 [Bacteroidia bacterium]|jgi:hypothetical protein|nr:hypothetical protein [Bacteroidia bacterium]
MKTLFITAFLLCTIICYSQTTTQEEYNYVVKGYKLGFDQGADIKKGYTLKELGEWVLDLPDGNRSVDYKALCRDNDTKPCAIMAIYKEYNKYGKVASEEYYCLPSEDANDLWDETFKQLHSHHGKSDTEAVYQAMLNGFMHFSSFMAAK